MNRALMKILTIVFYVCILPLIFESAVAEPNNTNASDIHNSEPEGIALSGQDVSNNMVTVSGKVICDNYDAEKNVIIIYWTKHGSAGERLDEEALEKTATFSLKIPKNTDKINVYVEVVGFDNPGKVLFSDSIEALIEEDDIILDDFYPKASTVKVSGRILYDNFKEGEERITVRIDQYGLGKADQSEVIFEKPGNFSIEVPRNLGRQFICAQIFIDKSKPSIATGTSKPIEIGLEDINIGDLRLEEIVEEPSLLTSYVRPGEIASLIPKDYKGSTIKISGRIIQKNYEKGIIRIRIGELGDVDLSGPGDYNIKVPAGIGRVDIAAVSIPEDDPEKAIGSMPGSRFAKYDKNPVYIESSDISDIDIVIE